MSEQICEICYEPAQYKANLPGGFHEFICGVCNREFGHCYLSVEEINQ